MSENWDSYFVRVDGAITSIFLDLDIAKVTQKETYPLLLSIRVPFKAPEANGMPNSEESNVLIALGHALEAAVEQWGGIYVARLTGGGRREFIFYARSNEGFLDLVPKAIGSFGYGFEVIQQRDAGWEVYSDFLYPKPDELRRILNRQVLERLQNHGDDLTKPRGVSHWIYFKTEQDRQRYAQWAQPQGFEVSTIQKVETAGRDFNWGVELRRVDSVQQQDIDSVTIQLLRAAQEHSGQYDGWECQVVKAGDEPTDDRPMAKKAKPWWAFWA